MRTWHTTLITGVLVTLVAAAVPSQAQQVTLGTPFRTLHDSFFENNSIGWQGNYKGITFSYGLRQSDQAPIRRARQHAPD